MVYFAVSDLEAVHERSFYAVDPWGNGLCFVDDTTLFTGL